MKNKGFLKHIDFEILEILSLILSFFIALYVRDINYNFYLQSYQSLFVFELLINILISYFYNPYKDILKRNKFGLISYSFGFVALQLMFVTLFLFAIKDGDSISRLFLAYEYIIYFVISIVFKFLRRRGLNRKSKNSIENGNKTLLIVTISSNIEKVYKDIRSNNYDGNKILGLCILDDNDLKEYKELKVVCDGDSLLSYVCNNWVDGVYFDLPLASIPKDIIDSLSYAGITTHIELKGLINTNYETHINNVIGNSVLSISVKERTNRQIILKKLMDLLGGLVGSLLTILLTIIIGPIIKIKSPGPIFYKQERIGLNGRHFYMWKFRSMVPNAEKHLEELKKNNRVSSDLMFKMENDPRIIPGIGNFIRKSSLDEFPQFFNVLKGDMSLVGTRPPTVDEWNKYELKHRIRMSTKPGITGMWQTSGRNTITDFDEVVKLDAKYIAEWTLGLDVKLILLTVVKLFKKDSNESM